MNTEKHTDTSCTVVALVSALLMGVCGILIRALKWTWLEQYALPLSMLGGMFLAIPITNLVDSLV